MADYNNYGGPSNLVNGNGNYGSNGGYSDSGYSGGNYDGPQRQVAFGEAVKMAFENYCNFSSRASRSEYWWFDLFNICVSIAIVALFGTENTTSNTISTLYSLAALLPGLGLSVRRLHDIGKSGWWLLIAFIPLVGVILLIIWFVKPSDPYTNEYGPVPNVGPANRY